MRRLTIFTVVFALAFAALTPTGLADWRDPGCEEDGSAVAATERCTPEEDQPGDPAEEGGDPCRGATFCNMTWQEIEAAGHDATLMREWEEDEEISSQRIPKPNGPTQLVFSLWDKDRGNCVGSVIDSGRCGWLYWLSTKDPTQGPVYSLFPARSGNNRPEDDHVQNVGPIPRDPVFYRWGFMNGKKTGYEADTRESFSPGKFRLDPWVVEISRNGQSYTRSAFEIHGGRGSREYWKSRTQGCIRVEEASMEALKTMWEEFASQEDSYVHVNYSMA